MCECHHSVVGENEFVITRVFDAPRAMVFAAWIDAKQVAQWWGPRVFTNPVCEIDARVGGRYRIVMRAPDGTDYPMKGVYREVVADERIVFSVDLSDHPDEWHERIDPGRVKGQGKPAMDAVTTVTFTEHNGKTTMTVHMRFNSGATRDAHVKGGMAEGWTESFVKLDKIVVTSDREIVTTRVFDAPRELVYRAWTEARHVAQWWGPNGFTSTIQDMDVRPGGKWRFVMHGPDGRNYPNEIVYVEIVKPQRLVYDHVMPPFHVTVTFDEQGGKTKVTMTHLFATADERETVVRKYGAVEGAKEHLGRLGAYLETM